MGVKADGTPLVEDAEILIKITDSRVVVAHTFNPSTREAEAGGSL